MDLLVKEYDSTYEKQLRYYYWLNYCSYILSSYKLYKELIIFIFFNKFYFRIGKGLRMFWGFKHIIFMNIKCTYSRGVDTCGKIGWFFVWLENHIEFFDSFFIFNWSTHCNTLVNTFTLWSVLHIIRYFIILY